MGIEMILEMASASAPERVAVGSRNGGLTCRELDEFSAGGASLLAATGARTVAYVGVNGAVLPILTFSSARAGIPLCPLNYRLPSEQIHALVERLDAPIVVADAQYAAELRERGITVVESAEFMATARESEPYDVVAPFDDQPAIILFTSGTTSAPKGVVLRHRHLLSYVLETVEFGSANECDATLLSTPPYHVAGISAILSNIYAGRRMVYLPVFTPHTWLETVRDEAVTSAMVVPTMLVRIVDHLGGKSAECPTLVSLAYGGARMPRPSLERALAAFPDVGFVNAYGLTETSSTVAVLGPEDHRQAMADPALRERLSSAGRVVPGIEAQIRDEAGVPIEDGRTGFLWVRGAQVSGEYMGAGSSLDEHGWFPARDRARVEDGYLYVEGRADDTIIRGGENIAPAEIEDILVQHEAVTEVTVVGLPDEEWGEIICAAIVLKDPTVGCAAEDFREWCRSRLRGSRTPDRVEFVNQLPRTDTGKLVRRELISMLTGHTAMSHTHAQASESALPDRSTPKLRERTSR